MNVVPFGGGGHGPDDPMLERRVLILEQKKWIASRKRFGESKRH
jgi:hypothetical protein